MKSVFLRLFGPSPANPPAALRGNTLFVLLSLLDGWTLLSARLVCREWSKLGALLVTTLNGGREEETNWEQCLKTFPNAKRLFPRKAKPLLDTLRSKDEWRLYCRHVETLEGMDEKLLSQLADFHALKALGFSRRFAEPSTWIQHRASALLALHLPEDTTAQTILSVAAQCPHLRRLTISDTHLNRHRPLRATHQARELLLSLLPHLEVTDVIHWTSDLFAELQSRPAPIGLCVVMLPWIMGWEAAFRCLATKFPRLQAMVFYEDFSSLSDDECKLAKEMHLKEIIVGRKIPAKLLRTLISTGNVKRLDVGSFKSKDMGIATILPNLEYLQLDELNTHWCEWINSSPSVKEVVCGNISPVINDTALRNLQVARLIVIGGILRLPGGTLGVASKKISRVYIGNFRQRWYREFLRRYSVDV